MSTKRTISALAAAMAVAVAAAVPAMSAGTPGHGHGSAGPRADIVDTAAAAGDFDTLAALLERAGLVDTLKGKRSHTVFAPTDAAFAKVPKATLDALANDRAKLRSVLLLHVAKGRLTARQVVRRTSIRTLNGQRLRVTVRGDTVRVGGARVLTPNVRASNGVIHVIDRVLIPR